MPWDPLSALPAYRRWLWTAIALFACLLQGRQFVESLRPPVSHGVDFFQEWASAKNFFSGLPVYTSHYVTIPRYTGLKVHRPGEAPADPGAVRVTLEVNAHPPTSILMTLPFGLLDYSNAVLVWNLVSLMALGLSLWLIADALEIRFAAWAIIPIVGLLLLCSPFREQMSQGQFNLVLLLLFTLIWVTARSGHAVWAGSLLALATAVKLFPGFLFLYFVLQKRWKVVISGVVAFMVLTVLTVVVLGPETYVTYGHDVLPKVQQFRSSWVNASLVGLFTKLFDPVTATERVLPLWRNPVLAQTTAMLACLAVLVLWGRVVWRAKTRPEVDFAYGLSITTMLLISPITWDHYFLLLIIPLAMLWMRLPQATWARGLFLLLLLLLCAPPATLWEVFIPEGRAGIATAEHTLTVLAYGCYGLIGIFAYSLALAHRHVRRHAGVYHAA